MDPALCKYELTHYAPDKGHSYGQGIRSQSVRKVWNKVQLFLNECTIFEPPSNVSLTAYRATDWDDDAVADSCVRVALDRFGPPDEEEPYGGLRWPSFEPVKGGHLKWNRSADVIDGMIQFLEEGEPWPKQLLGPVEIHMRYYFAWRDPDTGDRLVVLDGANRIETPKCDLSLFLGRTFFVQPTFWFPYSYVDPCLKTHLAHVIRHLPFKLNERHFRAAVPTRDGAGFRFRKLPHPLLDS